MRTIRQPGPIHAERVQWCEGRGRPLTLHLPAGRPLLAAVAEAFRAAGFRSGTVPLDGLRLDPFAYVMPALSQTPDHAAFYSETFTPAGGAVIEAGAMTFGERDGTPFFHAHALWREADGRRAGGHILPDGTALAVDASLAAMGMGGALFRAEPDSETNFKLFGPVPESFSQDVDAGDRRLFALRLRPNQDFIRALERFCRDRAIPGATIQGGVGSLIGARFTDGTTVEPFATEVAITGGRIDAAGAGSSVDVAMVDLTGAIAAGGIVPDDNPVLMTFELILEPLA